MIPGATRVVLTAALALACASGPAPVDHFYRLEARAPARLSQPIFPGTVEVDRLRADALTGERGLVYSLEDSGELQRHAYDLWVDAPTVMIQQALASYLREAGVAEQVVTKGFYVTPDVVIGGRINHLERLVGEGAASVLVELELGARRSQGDLLLHGIYREELPAQGAGVGASVQAFDKALTAIFERFVDDLRRG